jgi:hypothetical protein
MNIEIDHTSLTVFLRKGETGADTTSWDCPQFAPEKYERSIFYITFFFNNFLFLIMAKAKIDSADLKKGIGANAQANAELQKNFEEYKKTQAEKQEADAEIIANLNERLAASEKANADYKIRIEELEDLTSEEVADKEV